MSIVADPAEFAAALNEAAVASAELLAAERRTREHAARLGMLPGAQTGA
jgi:hypothetical protein